MFSDDVEQANLAKQDMDKLMSVLEKIQKDGLIAWNMADMCLELYKNTVNADYGHDIVKTFLIFRNNSKTMFDAYSVNGLKALVRKILTPYLELLKDGFKGDYKGIVFVGGGKNVDGSNNNNEKSPSKKQEDQLPPSSSSIKTTSNNDQISSLQAHTTSSNPSQRNNISNPVQSNQTGSFTSNKQQQQENIQIPKSSIPQISSTPEAAKVFNPLCGKHSETLDDQNANKTVNYNCNSNSSFPNVGSESESNVGIQISATPSGTTGIDDESGNGNGYNLGVNVQSHPPLQLNLQSESKSGFDPPLNSFGANFVRGLNNLNQNMPDINIGGDASVGDVVPNSSDGVGLSDDGLIGNGIGLDLGVKEGSYFPSLSSLNYIDDDHESSGSLLFNDVSNMLTR
ncbi:unnamed protein product [Ambrosiozyma monospora]|uniref:Unnamed protein product n=1 Tax=Ambrosiozyma monospora TaxID=43982 RepID=A0A9W6SVS3_AMBMO|nr:unnamed protein product [Ambrosiozyma monospora]